MNKNDVAYQKAEKTVKNQKSFYQHLTIYLIVNALLYFINMSKSPDVLWFYWPLFGWGIAVIVNWISVFVIKKESVSKWEQKKINDILDKEGK